VVVFGSIEEFAIRWVHCVIVLRVFDVEVVDPAKFSVDISLLGKFSVVWHAGSFHIVFFKRVKLALRMEQHALLVLKVLVKVLLIVSVIGPVEVRRRYMMTVVPVNVSHTGVICVVFNDLFLAESESVRICILTVRQVN